MQDPHVHALALILGSGCRAGTATITKATQTSTRLGLKAFCQGRRGKLQPANVREYLAASAVDLPDDDDKAFSLEELQATWLKVDVTFKKARQPVQEDS